MKPRKRLIIVGSPRAKGRSAHLADTLFETNIAERPQDELFLVPLSEVEVGPCIGCNACRKTMPVTFKDDNGDEMTEERHRCIFDDDMQTLYDLIDEADEVTVVSPVYFSGAPSQMKCLLDRLQPYFWARLEVRESGAPLPEKRPLNLHILGEGGDPHGYAALVSEVKSAFATADFRLQRIFDWVGKVSPQGDILADAEEFELTEDASALQGEGAVLLRKVTETEGQDVAEHVSKEARRKDRPQLKLSDKGQESSRNKKSSASKARHRGHRGN